MHDWLFYMLIFCFVNLRNLFFNSSRCVCRLHRVLYMQSCCLGTEIDRPRKQLSPPLRGCAWRTHHLWHGQWENVRAFPWYLATRAGLTVPTFTASAESWLFSPEWLGGKKKCPSVCRRNPFGLMFFLLLTWLNPSFTFCSSVDSLCWVDHVFNVLCHPLDCKFYGKMKSCPSAERVMEHLLWII